jgi:hypothetical protein
VTGNRPTGDSAVAGGIVLASARSVGGADPSATVVRGNEAHGNDPADLVVDGSGSANRVAGNRCGSSHPKGLCG